METSRARERELGERTALVVGAGGLGCPAVAALAEAGVGRIVVLDPDRVERSNLHRQVLYRDGDVGRPKAEVAAERIRERFGTEVLPVLERVTAANAARWVEGAGVVVDGSDDPACGFALADAALRAGIPAVLGGVVRFEGVVFAQAPEGRPCWRCLFEDAPAAGEAESCSAAGVLGPMAGVVGHLQAERALALLRPGNAGGDRTADAAGSAAEDAERATKAAGRATKVAGLAPTGYVTTLDGLSGRVRHVAVRPLPGCPACDTKEPMTMSVTIKIPTSLRKFAGGHDHVVVDGADVRTALDGLERAHPGIKAKICDEAGNLRRFINVYANQEDIRFLENLDTKLSEGAELQIVPAIAGGR